jgi:hypothetical protein
VHWDFLHLLGNMVALLLFGVPFEQRVGPRKFLAIYFLGGLAATLAQVGAEWGHATFLVGASGCIFAILGAFAIRFPNQVVPVPLFFLVIPMRVVYGAVAYLALQILYLASYQDVPGLGGTAYYAHLGGAAAGVLLGLTLVRPGAAKSPIAVDLKALEPFARDPKTKVVWDHMIANHDEPAVFQAWLDRFFRSATCPTCGHRVAPRSSGTVVCTQNHRFDVRQGAPAPVAAASAPVRQG